MVKDGEDRQGLQTMNLKTFRDTESATYFFQSVCTNATNAV